MSTSSTSLLVVTDRLSVRTRGNNEIVDLTDRIESLVRRHALEEGHVLVFVPGSTAGITTMEYEPGLLRDVPELLERIAPRGARYHHDETWHDGNGHSHVRAALIGPSLVIPVVDGGVLLGRWQQVVLIDFDNRPRDRSLVVQLQGRGGQRTTPTDAAGT